MGCPRNKQIINNWQNIWEQYKNNTEIKKALTQF